MPLSPLKIEELLDEDLRHECEGLGQQKVCVRTAAIADLPSRFGDFQVIAFYNNRDDKEHAAFIRGDVTDGEDIPVRLHSECLTGDGIGSLRCDCGGQLQLALQRIGDVGAEPDREFSFDGKAIEPGRIQGRSVRMDFRGVKVAEDGLIEAELALNGGAQTADFVARQFFAAGLPQASELDLKGVGFGNRQKIIAVLENEPGAMGVIVGELAARQTENIGLVQID